MSSDSAAPVGLNCPGCGEPPMWLLGDGHQAFCPTDDCPWFTWDPALSLAQLNASMQVISLQSEPEADDPDCE